MKYIFIILFTSSLLSVSAQNNTKTAIEGPDTLNATFVAAHALARYEIAVVNGIDHINIINVYEPTEVLVFDLNGKLVYNAKIEQRTRIEKDKFAKGFYIIKTRSARVEAVKKLYL